MAINKVRAPNSYRRGEYQELMKIIRQRRYAGVKVYADFMDVFLRFPFKKQSSVNGKPIKDMYWVRDRDVSSHRYAVSKEQLREMIEVYTDAIIDHLLTGDPFDMVSGMGQLQLIRNSEPDNPRWMHLDGWSWNLAWFRKGICKVRFHNYFTVRSSRHFKRTVEKYWKDNPGSIYNIKEMPPTSWLNIGKDIRMHVSEAHKAYYSAQDAQKGKMADLLNEKLFEDGTI